MNDSEGSSKPIKVVDRRRFSEDGSLREDRPVDVDETPAPVESRPADPQLSATPDPTPAADPPTAPEPPPETSQDFLELVAMLAQQAELMLMGAEGLEAQPAQAKRVIDYLGALEAKTRGNLSQDEEQLLANLMFQLRTLYVQQAGS